MPWVRQSTLAALEANCAGWKQAAESFERSAIAFKETSECWRHECLANREILLALPASTVEALRLAPASVILNAIELPQPLSIDAANKQRMAQLREREKA